MAAIFAGVMSGTSLDGADAAIVDFSGSAPRTLAFASEPFDANLRERILRLCEPVHDSIDLAAEVSLELAELYSRVIQSATALASLRARDVAAVGCHGQTVRHRPDRRFTVQLNDPAIIAERCGIDVVADFRRRDLAAGGQGAPLVPAFHEAVFRDAAVDRAVVNIGGISNVTWLPGRGRTMGFDCGPGNVLLDGWARKHIGAHFDEDGKWASAGRTDKALLARLMQEPFLQAEPPKSTGRELFRLAWLEQRLPADYRTVDVQSTLTDFTAHAIIDAIERFCPSTAEVYLAGGGARNRALVARITAIAGRSVALTDALGVPTSQVEAMAFAWLAMKCVRREPVDLTSATGASAPRVLGAIYPA